MRRVLVGSGTCVLGLVQHLAEAERYWFGYHLAGAAWDADLEHGMAVPAGRAAADTLRWVMAHMTSETARHAGHADILRDSSTAPPGARLDPSGVVIPVRTPAARCRPAASPADR